MLMSCASQLHSITAIRSDGIIVGAKHRLVMGPATSAITKDMVNECWPHHFRTRGDPVVATSDADRVCLFCMSAA